jgi:hypothetical protein
MTDTRILFLTKLIWCKIIVCGKPIILHLKSSCVGFLFFWSKLSKQLVEFDSPTFQKHEKQVKIVIADQ